MTYDRWDAEEDEALERAAASPKCTGCGVPETEEQGLENGLCPDCAQIRYSPGQGQGERP